MTEVSSRRRKCWFIVAAAAAVVVVALLILWPVRPSQVALPSPNGYDDIVKAGAMLVVLQGDYRQLAEPELRQLVASNAPALELVRTGLARECRVPVEASQGYITTHFSQLPLLKRLANALAAEGKLAEIDGHTNRAACSYVDAIRLGHEASRGGLLIDALVGLACEGIGAAQLEKAVETLDAKDCRELIQQLQPMEARRQPAEETFRIERKWSQETYGLFMRLRAMISTRLWNPIGRAFQNYATKQQAASARQSQLVVALAKRAFALERGRPPSKLSELVPEYLSALPSAFGTNALQSAGTQP
jgi:hypothetical protein